MFHLLKAILVIFILNSYTTVSATHHEAENKKNKAHSLDLDKMDSFPINEIKNFVNVYSKIKTEFLSPIDDAVMINNAIKGMVDNLDEHSTFLDKEIFAKFNKRLKGDSVGVGIEIAKKNSKIVIMTSLYGGPAYEAGIRSGDKIIQINSVAITNQNLAKINDELSGLPNTFVTLYIEDTNENIKMYKLKRALIKIPSVFINSLKNQYIYIRISQFQEKTPSEIINRLRKEGSGNIQGLIIDLRDNPGGLLKTAIKTTDLFLSKGLIVSIENRSRKIIEKHSAKPPVIIGLKTPIVVIINEGTASAAEIMAGALKDSNRAILIGRNSFGKGSIQSIFSLPNKTAAKLTTSLYVLPSGNKIKTGGIQPDIFVEPMTLISNEYSAENKTDSNKEDGKYSHDYFLFQAINTLEVMSKIN